MIRSAKPSVHVKEFSVEKSAEKRLDYLFNINNIIKVKSSTLKSKLTKWREMNIYKVSRELKKEFESIREVDQQMQSLQHFQKELEGDQENQIEVKPLNLEKLFDPFDNLIEKDNRKIFAKKLRPQKNLIKEEDEEEEDETEKRIKQVMSRKESLGMLKKNTILEEDEESEERGRRRGKQKGGVEERRGRRCLKWETLNLISLAQKIVWPNYGGNM